jgi:hypothetical protein
MFRRASPLVGERQAEAPQTKARAFSESKTVCPSFRLAATCASIRFRSGGRKKTINEEMTMLKRCLSLVLPVLLMNALCIGQSHDARAGTGLAAAEKVKAKVARRGVGEKARVTVRLQNGTTVKGYVQQAGENDFVVKDKKTGASNTIAYADVADVKSGGGTSKWVWVGLGVGAAVVVGAVLVGKNWCGPRF